MPEPNPPEGPPRSPDQGTPEHAAALAELEQRAQEALEREAAGAPPVVSQRAPAPPADEEG